MLFSRVCHNFPRFHVNSGKAYYVSAVLDNYSIIKTNHNSTHLALSETYFIRKNKPKLNEGLKACVDFKVFDF